MSGNQRGPRRDHRAEAGRIDSYARVEKRATMACDTCGVVFHGGRCSWGAPPLGDVAGGLCPACERVRDRYPAGTIRIPGGLDAAREELEGLVRNAEAAERESHPLERLMDVAVGPEGDMVVTTTGIHLARAIAHKLERRLHKKAELRYPDEQRLLFVEFP